MKDLRASASTAVAAPIEECFALIEAVDRYPSWYADVVRAAEVLERDAAGHPIRARATLHASVGPVVRDFRLLLTVTAQPFSTVRLSRVPHDSSDPERFDVLWRLTGGAQTEIQLELEATLSVPRLVPVGGIGDTIASGFVTAAANELQRRRA